MVEWMRLVCQYYASLTCIVKSAKGRSFYQRGNQVYYDIDDARLTKWYVFAVKRHLSSVESLHRSISTNTPAPLRCLLLCPHQKRASGKARCDIVHCVTLWCTRRCLIRTHPQPEYQIGPQCRRIGFHRDLVHSSSV